MTKAQVAERLQVTQRTVDRYIADEHLPAHRLGSGPKAQIRVFSGELDEWIRLRWSCETPDPGAVAS